MNSVAGMGGVCKWEWNGGSLSITKALGPKALLYFLHSQLLTRSASVRGFLLFHYMEEYKPTVDKLVYLYDSGKLKCNIDFGRSSLSGGFKGLDSVVDAVEV